MNGIQFLTDASGKRQSAVIPIELFEKLVAESELDIFFESVPYEAGPNDDETYPHEIVTIRNKQDVPMHVAWRLHRGLTREQVAEALGISTSGVAKMETRAKPHKATLQKLAKLYDCRVTQLYLE
ncbi:helix-turn-helix transcriptional regulator [Pantoea sp.]|uniref:helix-turn-helix domain-containing protein n=1 Tax=Pantoea sp. TaxID=69393 RepID=UPI00289ADB72|nr:helix-turn-helix transcriptional regulator [Pantoea sp.]